VTRDDRLLAPATCSIVARNREDFLSSVSASVKPFSWYDDVLQTRDYIVLSQTLG